MPKTKLEFFDWCQDRHLTSDELIADLFALPIKDVAQWRIDVANGTKLTLGPWVASVAATFDHFIGDDFSPDCVSRIPRTKDKFFKWCHDRGINQTPLIASLFRLSDQTVRNWEKHVAEGKQLELPYWVPITIECFDHFIGDSAEPDCHTRIQRLPAMTFASLKKWQNKHGLETYQDTGDMFRIKRQAVHNWLQRQSLPDWLAFACEAINLRRLGKSRKLVK